MHPAVAALSVTLLLQGCASWRADDAPLPTQASKAVPAATLTAAPQPGRIGENTIARYGGDISAPAHAGTITPVISLMPVAPAQYGAPGMVRPERRYGFDPPPQGQPAPEPTAAMAGRGGYGNPCASSPGAALAGAVIGGVLGHQVGDGSGRNAATALGAALGALAAVQVNAARDNCP